jgi:hypothetical protein
VPTPLLRLRYPTSMSIRLRSIGFILFTIGSF